MPSLQSKLLTQHCILVDGCKNIPAAPVKGIKILFEHSSNARQGVSVLLLAISCRYVHLLRGCLLLESSTKKVSEKGRCIVEGHVLVIQGQAEEATAQKVPIVPHSCCSRCLQDCLSSMIGLLFPEACRLDSVLSLEHSSSQRDHRSRLSSE